MEKCVVKILGNSATSFAACFYNEKKVAEGTAKCISMRNFGELEKYFIHSPVVLSKYLQKIADHNSMVKHPQKHLVFSFPGKATPEEAQQLLKDAAETLDRLGYQGQPQVFWLHNDTENTHIHAASVTVSVRNGLWIDNYMEGRRARRILDQLRGVNLDNDVNRMLDYGIESREQFKSLMIASGYRCHHDEANNTFDIWRNHDFVGSMSVDEIDNVIKRTGRNKDNHKDVVKNLRGILLDRRRRSMKMTFDQPDRKQTKSGEHTVTKKLKEVKNNRFNGDKGLDIEGERKAQFKQFLLDLKRDLGISVVFSQWKDGSTKGYTLIDHKDKLVFKGSDIVDLQKLLNPDWRKGQIKDAVITANDAAAMADEIRQSENLPQAIEQQLERLGIDIIYSKEDSMAQYSNDGEEENAWRARSLMRQLVTMIRNNEDATEEGTQKIHTVANEAISRAVCADGLRLLEKERAEEQRRAEEQARIDEQQKAQKRAEDAKTMTVGRIGQYVTDVIDDYNIPHDPGGHEFNPLTGMKEDVCIRAAMKFLEDAITSPWDKKKNANLAIGYARAAERLHNEAVVRPDKTTAVAPNGKNRNVQWQNFNLPFVALKAKIEDGWVKVLLNGSEQKAQLSEEQLQWYLNQTDDRKGAFCQAFAMHYFADLIQKEQIKNCWKMFREAGKIPHVDIQNVRIYPDNSGNRYYCTADFEYENGLKEHTPVANNEITQEMYIAYRKGEKSAAKIAAERYFDYCTQNISYPTISKLKKNNDCLSPPDSGEAVKETLKVLDDFSNFLCKLSIESLGEVAEAYIESIGGDGQTAGLDGGGESAGSTRNKDDDEWWKNNDTFMGMRPRKKSSGGRKV